MLLFFITKYCSKTMPSWCHFACSCFLVGREVNTIALRVWPVTKKERGWERQQTLILVWVLSINTKTDECAFFIRGLMLYQIDAFVTSFCVHLYFGGREVNTGQTRVSYLCCKKKGKKKVKMTSALGRKIDTLIGAHFKGKHKNRVSYHLCLVRLASSYLYRSLPKSPWMLDKPEVLAEVTEQPRFLP